MDKIKAYILGRLDNVTAWVGALGIIFQLLGLHTLLFGLFVLLIILPQANFTNFFGGAAKTIRDLEEKK